MALRDKTVGFLGAGNMAEALIRGLLNAETISSASILATARRPERLALLNEKYGVQGITTNIELVQKADIVVLSVKPQILGKVLAETGSIFRQNHLVVSVAAGYPMVEIQRQLPEGVSLCRAMPNMPAVVGAAATGLVFEEVVSGANRSLARSIFEAAGLVVELSEEGLLDGVTGLSGSGPAYVFMIIEALADAGVRVGLPRRQAQALAAQTVLGSAKLLIETKEHPGVLKDKVTSPGGTAIAGLHTLEDGGLRTTLINAVVEATKRSEELGAILDSK